MHWPSESEREMEITPSHLCSHGIVFAIQNLPGPFLEFSSLIISSQMTLNLSAMLWAQLFVKSIICSQIHSMNDWRN